MFGMGLIPLIWIVLVLLVVLALRALFPPDRLSEHEAALELLAQRYAANQITHAEYEQARRILDATGDTQNRS